MKRMAFQDLKGHDPLYQDGMTPSTVHKPLTLPSTLQSSECQLKKKKKKKMKLRRYINRQLSQWALGTQDDSHS